MNEGWVVFAYVVVYGFMIAYGAYLAARGRSLKRRRES